jgi:hypothetical protein
MLLENRRAPVVPLDAIPDSLMPNEGQWIYCGIRHSYLTLKKGFLCGGATLRYHCVLEGTYWRAATKMAATKESTDGKSVDALLLPPANVAVATVAVPGTAV